MKVRSAIKCMCEHCYIVKRRGTRFVYCRKSPKHKQRQGFATLLVRDAAPAPLSATQSVFQSFGMTPVSWPLALRRDPALPLSASASFLRSQSTSLLLLASRALRLWRL